MATKKTKTIETKTTETKETLADLTVRYRYVRNLPKSEFSAICAQLDIIPKRKEAQKS